MPAINLPQTHSTNYHTCLRLVAQTMIHEISNHFVSSYTVLQEIDTFELDQLEFKTLAECKYMVEGSVKHIYLYHSYG
jgi:hypothetical protein